MIMLTQPGRLRLTFQTDHALVAGLLAANWGGARFARPEPLERVKLAVDLHDQGWLEWEQAPRLRPDTGRPYDFLSLPVAEHIRLHSRSIARAVEQDAYAGLLVSMHGSGLYRQRYGFMPHLRFKQVAPDDVPIVERFVCEQESLQQQLREALKPDMQVLWTHYRWLQAWDLISVVVCLTDPAERIRRPAGVFPLFPGGPETEMVINGDGPGSFRIDPWPFHIAEVGLSLPVRYVEDRRYGSDAEFQACLWAAPVKQARVTLLPVTGVTGSQD